MTLTKHQPVGGISEETGLLQAQVLDVARKTLDPIPEILAKGDNLELHNFGLFEVRITQPPVGRNPRNPDLDRPIPARTTVKFQADGKLKDAVFKLAPKQAKKGA